MDEYRGRYAAYGRQEEAPPHHHHAPPPPQQEPHYEPEPQKSFFPGLGALGLGGDLLGDYLPILLVILVLVGLYLFLGKGDFGLGSLLGGFLK